MTTVQAIILLASALVASGQRPSFAGIRPIGYPELLNRTTTTPSGLEDKFGEVTTQRLPIEAQGDRELVDRLSKLPIDKQPFWFINWQALEANREKPQTYPLKPSPFLESNFQNTGPINNPSTNPNPGSVIPNPNLVNRNPDFTNSGIANNPNAGVANNQNTGFVNPNSGIVNNPTPGFVNSNPNTGFTNSNANTGFFNPSFANANPGFANANTGFTNTNPGFVNANPGFANTNRGYVNVNPGFANANPGFANANPGFSNANPGFANANPGFANANPAFANANPAFANANPAFANANPGFVNANPGFANANHALTNTNFGNTSKFKPGSGIPYPNLRGQEPITTQNGNTSLENRYGTETNIARDTTTTSTAVNTSNYNDNAKAVVSNTDNIKDRSSEEENEFEDIEVKKIIKKH